MTHRDNLNQAILSIASKKASTDSSQSRHLEKMGTRYSGRGSSHYQYTFPNEQNHLTVPGFVKVDPATNLISQYLEKLIKPKKKTQVGKDPNTIDPSIGVYNKSREIVAGLDIENYKLDPIGLKPTDPGYNQTFADQILKYRQINIIDAAKKSKELEVPSIETANESTTESHMNNILKNKIKNQCYKVLFERFTDASSEVLEPQSAGPAGTNDPKNTQKKRLPEGPAERTPESTPQLNPPQTTPRPQPKPEVEPTRPQPKPKVVPKRPPAPGEDGEQLKITPAPAPAVPAAPAPEPTPELPEVILVDNPPETPSTDDSTDVYQDNTIYPPWLERILYGSEVTPAAAAVAGSLTTLKSRPGRRRRISNTTGKPSNATRYGIAAALVPTGLRMVDQMWQGWKEGETTNLIKGWQDQIPHLIADLFGLYGGAGAVGIGKRVQKRQTTSGVPITYEQMVARGGRPHQLTGRVQLPPSGGWPAGNPGPAANPGYTTNRDFQLGFRRALPLIAKGAAATAGTGAVVGLAGKMDATLELARMTANQSNTDRDLALSAGTDNPGIHYQSKDWYTNWVNSWRMNGPAFTRTTPTVKQSLTNIINGKAPPLVKVGK